MVRRKKEGRRRRRRRREGSSELPKESWHARIPRRNNTFTLPALFAGKVYIHSSFIVHCDIAATAYSMPQVKSYAPAWLCRPSPGASLFTSTSAKSPAQELQKASKVTGISGATRTIAKRGNEVFAVVDNEIRWSDLARLKDQWQQQSRQKKAAAGQSKEKADGNEVPSYRVSQYQLD